MVCLTYAPYINTFGFPSFPCTGLKLAETYSTPLLVEDVCYQVIVHLNKFFSQVRITSVLSNTAQLELAVKKTFFIVSPLTIVQRNRQHVRRPPKLSC